MRILAQYKVNQRIKRHCQTMLEEDLQTLALRYPDGKMAKWCMKELARRGRK